MNIDTESALRRAASENSRTNLEKLLANEKKMEVIHLN